MPELVPAESDKFPEVVVRDWKFAMLLYCCGYWLTRLSLRAETAARSHPRYIYHFRMTASEYSAVIDAYFSSELKLAARAFGRR